MLSCESEMETDSVVRSSDSRTSSKMRSNEIGQLKMMKKCIVCSARHQPSTTLSFFHFPKDIERKTLWINALNLKIPINKWHRICNDHFENDQFVNRKTRNKLLPTAVPFAPPSSCDKNVPYNLPSPCSPSSTIVLTDDEEDVPHNLSSLCIFSSKNDNKNEKNLPQSFSSSHVSELPDHEYVTKKILLSSSPCISSIDHDYVKKAPQSLPSSVPSTLNNPKCVPNILPSLKTNQAPKTLLKFVTLKKQTVRDSPSKSVSTDVCINEMPLLKQMEQNLNCDIAENLEKTYSSSPMIRQNSVMSSDRNNNLKKKYKSLYQKYNDLHGKYKRLNKMFCNHLKQCKVSDVGLFD